MCKYLKLISRVSNGELTYCANSKTFHLIFNNLFFEFNRRELLSFRNYINQIDTVFWKNKYNCSEIKRAIPIPSMQQNLLLLFNEKEIKEIRVLLSKTNNKREARLIGFSDIDYTLLMN